MTYFKIVKEIFQEKKFSLKKNFLIAYFVSQRFSPFFSAFYIKRRITPNTITLHMILSGIIGGLLFVFPDMRIKFLGMLFMQIWFILDCSDGEVARKTKVFSKFGQELDYLAHIIDHPIFTIALCISILQKNIYSSNFVISLFALNIILDFYNRSIFKLNIIKDLKEDKEDKNKVEENISKNNILKEIALFFLNVFIVYPNFILFSSIFYFINPSIVIYYSFFNILFTFLIIIKTTLNYLKSIVDR